MTTDADGKINPNYGCTRAQALYAVWAMHGKPAPTVTSEPFGDVTEADTFYSAVLWAEELNFFGHNPGDNSCGENVRWSVENGVLTISGTGPMKDYAADSKPAYFYAGDSDSLTSIVIEEGVTAVGDFAFAGLSKVQSVSFPNTLTSIGLEAFWGTKLTEVVLPDSVTLLGDNAFANCTDLKTVTLSNQMTAIGANTFWGCDSLQSIVIPASVTEVGQAAFKGCVNLASVSYGGTKEQWDAVTVGWDNQCLHDAMVYYEGASAPEVGNVTWSISGNTLTISGTGRMENYGNVDAPYLADPAMKNVTNVVIENGITAIGANAFCGCDNLTSVSIPASVTAIEKGAFSACWKLNSVHIPNSVTVIGDEAFKACEKLSAITLPNSLTSIGAWAFSNCPLARIEIPASVTTIGDGAFSVTNLTTVTVPQTVTSLGSEVFGGCGKLQSVTIHAPITSLGARMFEYCENLVSVALPDSLTTIEEVAFMNCKKLPTVKIPEGVTTIGRSAFGNCKGLTSIAIPASVTTLGDRVFSHSGLQSVTVPATVTDFGVAVFADCAQLTSVTLSYGLREVPEQMFLECAALKAVTIPDSVITIGASAFAGCKLQSIAIPNSVQTIGNAAFRDSALTAVTIPNSVTTIGDGAFTYSESLTAVTIPASVTSIGRGAFQGCEKLATVSYDGTKEQWGQLSIGPYNECLTGANISFAAAPPTPGAGGFYDVAETDWFAKPVVWAKEKGVTGGLTDTTFGPNADCTRAQVVTFLWAAAGKPEPKSMDNPFTDVANDAWYVKPVLWAVENGITGGIGEGLFGPDATCSRAQIVTFLYGAQGKPAVSGSSDFSDVANDAWYLKSVLWAAQNEVTGGIGEGKFGPDATCTRGQVVTFLYKVYG